MDWRKFPLICAIISAGAGIKILAEKQMEAVSKMQGTIQLLEAIRLPSEENSVPVLPDRPAPVPEPPKQAQKTLIMHTMSPCIWCRSDKAKIIPVWVSKGYNVSYVDDGAGVPGQRYPWYEITDATNTKKIHVGTLGAFR